MALPAVPAVPLDSPQSVSPTWILTVPGLGGTANLKFLPFTLTLRISPRYSSSQKKWVLE